MTDFAHRLDVRFRDCDALGHVNNAVYLTYLELFVINAICQWCVASAVLMTLLFVVSALRAFGYVGAELMAQPMPAHADEP